MSSDGLTFFYGQYEHPKGEVYPAAIEFRPQHTNDGVQWCQDVRYQIKGSFVNQDPELDSAGVNARIAELDQVYRFDYRDFGFRLTDGSLTDHYLLTDDVFNLSGNRITARSWDHLGPTELANTRSFSVTLSARILATYTNIIYFKETVKRTGTGGPEWRLYPTWNGDPVKETINTKTKIYHEQTGIIIGLDTWPTIPAPYWPNDEMEWRRVVRQTSPMLHGHLSFSRATHYTIEYSYFFERIESDSQRPALWG